MTAFPVAKVYLRSLVCIVSTTIGVVTYGMCVAPIGDQVLIGWLGVCGAVVLFDKPKIGEDDAA